MKKGLVGLGMAALIVASLAIFGCQGSDNSANDQVNQTTVPASMEAEKTLGGFMMKGGKMMTVYEGGNTFPMENGMQLSSGMKVMMNGKVMMTDGSTKMIGDGQMMTLDGKMTTKDDYMAMEKEESMKGVTMKDGKMMTVMEDGKTGAMEKEAMMKDGTKVMMDGKLMMKDGTSAMMKEGEMMDMTGKLGMMTDMMNTTTMPKDSDDAGETAEN